MLTLKSIHKKYGSVTALDSISISFRDHEFVSILGPSGCGKTTLLNIVGGLDRYTSGDLFIRNVSTKSYKDRDWDAYRNQSIGFVFQSYNLIPHLTIRENVALSLKLSGIKNSDAMKAATKALHEVGLADHIDKKPNQLSGGQAQRVAIARALGNDPEIILADEPTGALDSQTSLVIMDLLREISKTRLVIMVTHNAQLAHDYSTRTVELLDGAIIADSNPYIEDETQVTSAASQKHTKMPYKTALGMSGKNLLSKKGRTFLISIAGSIGIIGIALVLALSNGLKSTMADLERDTLASAPITIEAKTFDFSTISNPDFNAPPEFPNDQTLTLTTRDVNHQLKTNNLSEAFVTYMKTEGHEDTLALQINDAASLNLLTKRKQGISVLMDDAAKPSVLLPQNDLTEEYYDLLEGKIPTAQDEAVFVIDKYNRMDTQSFKEYGFDVDGDRIALSDLVGKEYRIIANDSYYTEDAFGVYRKPNSSQLESLFNDNDARAHMITIVGVIREKPDATIALYKPGLFITDALSQELKTDASTSQVVLAQREAGSEFDVVTGLPFIETPFSSLDEQYQNRLRALGNPDMPTSLSIYPKDFSAKERLRNTIDAYNKKQTDDVDRINYTDLSESITDVIQKTVDTVSYVLIGFSSISLFVSSLMIGIITYVSVIERTKEIGVLRSLGARKKDISRVFNAETFIIGIVSGTFGVLIAYALTFPINTLILKYANAEGIANLNPTHALILIAISTVLTLVAGFIPSRIAAKKDPVVALRSE